MQLHRVRNLKRSSSYWDCAPVFLFMLLAQASAHMEQSRYQGAPSHQTKWQCFTTILFDKINVAPDMLAVTRLQPLEGTSNMLYPRLKLVAQCRHTGAASETVPKVQSPSSRALAPFTPTLRPRGGVASLC